MAENSTTRPTSISGRRRRQPSRLQRRAPATLQITPAAEWNVAIPLLSPLVSPSSSPNNDNKSSMLDRTAKINPSRNDDNQTATKSSAAAAAFKKWQHPAAPFCYDTAPMVRPFVPV